MRKLVIVLFVLCSQLSIAQNENSIELPEGWSLFGYNCLDTLNVEQAFSPIVDSIVIVKDYLGYVYLPEYNVNTIGNLVHGRGYQIKMNNEVHDFSFCESNCLEFNVADSLQQLIDSNTVLINELQEQLSLYGCTVDSACNFSGTAEIENGTCIYAQVGYDCDGDQLQNSYEVGDFAQGGIVFYIDETGEHGLVAALEDLAEGANMGYWGVPEGFEWGCFNENVTGTDDTIGTGLENSQAIVNQGCATEFGGITAAQSALNYESGGYSDWYLPPRVELLEMYNTIGNGGPEGNIGGFETSDFPWYWSSIQLNYNNVWYVKFSDGNVSNGIKDYSLRVRVVRAF